MRFYLLRLVAALALMVTAGTVSAQNPAVLSGRILHLPDSVRQLDLTLESFGFLEPTAKETVTLDANGQFSVSLKIKHPVRGFLSLGRVPVEENFVVKTAAGRDTSISVSTFDPRLIYVYLQPGQQQELRVDAARIRETLQFSGHGHANSLYINQDDWAFNSYPDRYMRNYHRIVHYGPDAFKALVDRKVGERLGFLHKYAKKHRLARHLREVYGRDIVNEGISAKIYYPVQRPGFLKVDSIALPEDYYEFLTQAQLAKQRKNKGVAYFYYLDAILKKRRQLLAPQTDLYDFSATQLSKKDYYEYLAYKLAGDFRKVVYERFYQGNPYKALIRLVREKYAHMEGMLEGSPAPAVSLTGLQGEQVTFAAFEGTYLYIDFWATWCVPCIEEIPSLQQLEKDYAGRNIRFMSISFDDEKDRQKWLGFVHREQLTGAQYWVDKANKSILSSRLNIKSIPRFILLDPQGNMVDANAPRPSEARVRALLDGLL